MISILTPTYNRAHTLPRLYKSLKQQTMKDFEWIIVDDGSTDNTKYIVEKWIKEINLFNIIYIKQKNGGKHRALNKGIPHAKYDYIYIVDSDDYLTDDAVEKIHLWISTIDNKSKFAGVSGLRGKITDKGMIIIGQFPSKLEFIDATNLERKSKKLLGDKAEVYRKDILLKYPFPEFEGEKFLTEAVVWNRIAADGYKIRWFNKIICICEYLDDGLTKTDAEERRINNFNGYTCFEKMNVKLYPFPYSAFAIGRYFKLARKKGIKVDQIIFNLEINKFSLFIGVCMEYLKTVIKNILQKIPF